MLPAAWLRGHSLKLYKPRCHTTLRQNFFSIRVINEWNKLPQFVIEAPSVNAFKNRLDKHRSDMGYYSWHGYTTHQSTSSTSTSIITKTNLKCYSNRSLHCRISLLSPYRLVPEMYSIPRSPSSVKYCTLIMFFDLQLHYWLHFYGLN